jgi:hypothetical protein
MNKTQQNVPVDHEDRCEHCGAPPVSQRDGSYILHRYADGGPIVCSVKCHNAMVPPAPMPPPAPPAPKEGWVALENAAKYHYVVEGRSLCGRWLYLGTLYDDQCTGGSTPKDCKACTTKLNKRKAKK